VHIACMEQVATRDFACPRCQARYKIIRMRSEPGIVHQMLQCRVCEEQLASTENDHVLKYFLVSRPAPRGSSCA
jgi:transcription elongation factor Elf1